MTEIRLVKKYPHIKDEDVTSIFQEGYIKGFENGRKGAIPIEWFEWLLDIMGDGMYNLRAVIKDWERYKEDWGEKNETD